MGMSERRLGLQMLEFEREQAAMKLREPLPCDGKLITQQSKRWDRTEEIFWLIKRNHGITTMELFELVNFGYGDFSASLRHLVWSGKLLVGTKGRATTYAPVRRM